MSVVAVTDTGPLIHLAEIDALSLLTLIDRLYVPETVYDELDVGGIPTELTTIEYTLVEANVDSIEREGLDPGETAALAVAQHRNAVLLTDDLAARERATEHGIAVHGSIGVIAFGYSRGRLDRDEAVSLMRELQHETRLFVTNAVVERGIELLDDE